VGHQLGCGVVPFPPPSRFTFCVHFWCFALPPFHLASQSLFLLFVGRAQDRGLPTSSPLIKFGHQWGDLRRRIKANPLTFIQHHVH